MSLEPQRTGPLTERHVVLVRGLIRSRFHWHSFPRTLLQQNAIHDVVLPELAGNGDRHLESTPFGIHAMMEDIRQQARMLLADHVASVCVVGISMGGMIATEWAKQYPDEVRELHLINTSFGCCSRPWQRMKPPALSRLLKNLTNPLKLEQAIAELTLNTPPPSTLMREWLEFAREHPVSTANTLTQVMSAARYRGHQQAPAAPSFFYSSSKDRLVSGRCSEAIASRWNAPISIHPEAGHDLPLDDPDWLIDQIVRNSLSTQ
ncbi:MAG: alpha/beta hydrolase [Oceanospirillaceae bacterium]|nr:alpha/beta hydrolase [Oceanospirillaceae bacterium]|tara:strand:- start:541 stop:1326 length:786 start_codon:yes stop_codon:yes gene_type:complete